jgi:hypothetical protein
VLAAAGAPGVTPDCRFAVPPNHFIPGFLSYSVAVAALLKWQSDITPGVTLGENYPRPLVEHRGETDRGAQGALLEPPGPLLTHLRTVYIACSVCLPTRLNPLAERAGSSQVEHTAACKRNMDRIGACYKRKEYGNL